MKYKISKTGYNKALLKSAIKKDIESKNSKCSFYALVIHSNFNKPIFKTAADVL